MRRLIAFLVSATLLVLLYRLIDFSTLTRAMRMSDPALLAAGVVAVIPLTLGTAWRFSILIGHKRIGILKSIELILVASTLNLFLPSKMGDIAKAAVLVDRDGIDGKLALSICIFEKTLDLASLVLLGVIALFYVANNSPLLCVLGALTASLLLLLVAVILPVGLLSTAASLVGKILNGRIAGLLERFSETWQSVVLWFWSDRRRAVGVLVLSIAIWAGHLMQFWLFALAIGAIIPILDNMAFATLGILAGLLPFTFAGIGSRDVALVHFYRPYLTPGEGALLGILATLRYVIPAIAGLPFVGQSIRRFGASRNATTDRDFG
jgi:glycosyltransferase 2 family protein